MRRAPSCIYSGLLSVLGWQANALAQSAAEQLERLEEIVVTASKRGAADIQDIPYNISAISSETLERVGADDLRDIVGIVPGLSAIDNGPNNRKLVMRGLAASAGTPQVAMFIDELPMSGSVGSNVQQSDLRLYDLERVEILRGPQGTLYGAGSQGGAVRYILNKPVLDTFEGSMDMSGGVRSRDAGDRYTFDGMLNVPLVEDKFGLRAVGYYRQVDGVTNLPDINRFGTDEEETYGGRLVARWLIGEDTSLTGYYLAQSTSSPDRPEVTESSDSRPGSVLQAFADDLTAFNLTLEHNFNWALLTATGSYFKRESNYEFDITPALPPQIPLAGALNQPSEQETLSGEIRLASTLAGAFQYILGAYVQASEENAHVFANFRDPATGGDVAGPDVFNIRPYQERDQAALFGEVSFDVTDRWNLLAGARAFRMERFSQTTRFADAFQPPPPGGYPFVDPPLESEFEDMAFRLLASFDVTDDILLYGTISEGFRDGGENPPVPGGNAPPTFAPDFVRNYELGLKSVLGGQLVLNAAAYYMDWEDIQVSQLDPTQRFFFTANAGAAELIGAEIETVWRPATIKGLTLSVNVRVSEQELSKDNPNAVAGDPLAGLKGERIPNTSPFGASVSLEKRFVFAQRNSYFRWTSTFQGEARTTFSSLDPAARVWGDFSLSNAQLGIEGARWRGQIYIRNVFDEREPLSWLVQAGFPDLIVTTPPREIGIGVGVSF